MKKILFCVTFLALYSSLVTAQNSDLNIAEQILHQSIGQHQLPILVFGPQKYDRATGSPQTVTQSFTLPSNTSVPYTLIVVNPFSLGSTVTSATISINGTTIFSPSDFKKFHPLLTKSVALQATNMIQVTVAGKPKTFLLLAVIGKHSTTQQDTIPPTLSLSSPVDGFITNTNNVTVNGIATDQSAVTVMVNGSAVTVGSGGAFSTAVTLSEGTNTITVIATDASNNQTTKVRTVIKDAISPSLTVSTPENGTTTIQLTTLVQGTVYDSTTVLLTINGLSVSVSPAGTFTYSLSLNEGSNEITTVATDASGNSTTDTRTVTRSTIPPAITVSSPTDGGITNQSLVTVSGTVSSTNTTELKVNGTIVTIGSGGTFSTAVLLSEGTNAITIIATDNVGNTSTVIRTVRLDSTDPTISISQPPQGYITTQSSSDIIGTIFDSTAVTVTVNGNPVTLAAGGVLNISVSLVEGNNTVIIIATDQAGNSSTITRNIIKDSTIPQLTVSAPNDGIYTTQTSVVVSGTVTDGTTVSLSINGNLVSIGSGGVFSQTIFLNEGANAISVVAIDAAGNNATVTRTVIKDAIPPTVVLYSPASDTLTKQSSITINGTVADSAVITVTFNGDTVIVGSDGSYSGNVQLNEGKNIITIIATDAAENSTTVTRTVTMDSTPPSMTVSDPTEGIITIQNSVAVSGTVNDSTTVTVVMNGDTVEVNSGTFTHSVTLNEGHNIITIVATDGAGNLTTLTRTVIKDSQNPSLTVVNPENGIIVNQNSIVVSGTVFDSTIVVLTVNGTSVLIDSTGSFNLSFGLVEGLNNITITATDAAGNISTIIRTIILDSQSPLLIITSPANNLITNQTSVTISGSFSDSNEVVMSVNGNIVLHDGNGNFTTSVVLSEGTNTITIESIDAAGNISTEMRTVILDTVQPTLVVTSPNNSLLTQNSLITVNGTVNDSSFVTITINGNAVTAINGIYSSQVALNEGSNTIIIVVTDAAGNISTETRTVVRDSSVPTLTVTIPANNSITNQTSVFVSGTVIDSTTASITVNGTLLSIGSNGSFGVVLSLVEGINTITIVATDAAGNSATETKIVRLDTASPTVTNIVPADGITTQLNSAIISGSIDDSTATSLTINSIPVVINPNGSFSQQVILVEGVNIISLVITDAAGNSTSIFRSITYSTIPSDPKSIAPPLDTTVTTTIYDVTKFLYTGSQPIQTGVDTSKLTATRLAVIRGKVLSSCGTPLPGAKIMVLSHPEYGQTISRNDGMFDLVLNGGGYLTLQYSKSGFIPAQRQVQTDWLNYTNADSVILLPADSVATLIINQAVSQSAQSSTVTDADGTRRATLIFEPNTISTMSFSNGTSQSLDTITLRATEYGLSGSCVVSLPGTLPPTSALGYGVELTSDEAVNGNAKSVFFDKPFALYVNNFLTLPIGSKVPTAYFDSSKGIWTPINDGRAVKIISISSGLANLDVTGSGSISAQVNLDSLGISNDERQMLASMYGIGESFMRIETNRLGSFSFSWPFGPPVTAQWPKLPGPTKQTLDKDCTTSGSIIGIQNQTLGEVLPITGTPFSIYYKSDRVPGRKDAFSLSIPLTGVTLPPGLNRIFLDIEVAGQFFTYDFTPSVNLSYNFEWDGKDAYGRTLQGRQPIKTSIGYNYNASFQIPQGGQSFGNTSGSTLNKRRSNTTSTLWQYWSGLVGIWSEASRSLGSWTFNNHHVYDAVGQRLYYGDGNTRSAENANLVMTTVIGNGSGSYPGGTIAHDSDLAIQAPLNSPDGLAFGPEGNIYVTQTNNNLIQVVKNDGRIYRIAGALTSGGGSTFGYNGDNIPAISASLSNPMGIAVSPDGSIYFADTQIHRIRKISPDGIITTVAGKATIQYINGRGFSGDGGLAVNAELASPSNVAIGPDGSIYIADDANYRVRKVNPNGIITTIAGNGGFAFNGDNIPATTAAIGRISSLAVGEDGSVYFGSSASQKRIRRVGPDGIIRTIAGTGTGSFSGDCNAATSATINGSEGIDVDSKNNIIFSDNFGGTGNKRIRRVSVGGTISTIGGSGNGNFNGDGLPATGANIDLPFSVRFAPDGSMFFSDIFSGRVRKISKPFPQFSLNTNVIPSEDGSELFIFNYAGRHEQTLDALTGVIKFDFYYNSKGLLTHIRDIDSLFTTIERDSTGKATVVISPYGQRTYLYINNDGYLDSLTNPAGETNRFTYDGGGLMKTMSNPKNKLYKFTYNSKGLLTKDEDPLGGFKALNRTEFSGGYQVEMTTALGKKTTYRVERVTPGGVLVTKTDENGQNTLTRENPDGTSTITSPDSTVTIVLAGPDPRFGMMVPVDKSKITRKPSGLTTTESHGRLITQMAGLQVMGLRDSSIINGRVSKSDYSGITRTITSTTSLGRKKVSFIDTKGRVVKDSIPGITSKTNTYNSKGQLVQTKQGTRVTMFTYDNLGRLQSIQDPMLRTSSTLYDSVGRSILQILPDGRTIGYSYDANSNMTSLTPPSKPAHEFAYDDVDQKSAYNPPLLPVDGLTPTGYEYNLDKQNVKVVRADSTTLLFVYDTTGGAANGNTHIKTLTFDRGTISHDYNAKSGLITKIISAENDTLLYTYDGTMPIKEEWRGAVRGYVTIQYDSSFRVIAQKVNGGDSIGFKYNTDDQLTSVGALKLAYNSTNGLPIADTLVNVTTAISYSTLGEVSGLNAKYSGNSIFATSYTRDSLGRITTLNETIQGEAKVFRYAYDLAGRLEKVWRNDTLASQYVYDSTGNRLAKITTVSVDSGSYDVQDRLFNYANISYSYTLNGELQSKIEGIDTTYYSYDALGNLIDVRLPNGDVIVYLIDANNRRIGKKLNGQIIKRWIYENQLRPIAELDSNDNVVARFVYIDKPNVPEYIVKSGISYRIVTDHLGSVRLVLNSTTGIVVSRFDYDEYGNIINQIDSLDLPFGYAGGLFDTQTKLVRFGARDYDVTAGRWTSKDPILFEGKDINIFCYATSDPINFNDPNGKFFGLSSFWSNVIIQTSIGAATGAVMGAITMGKNSIDEAQSGGLFGFIAGVIGVKGHVAGIFFELLTNNDEIGKSGNPKQIGIATFLPEGFDSDLVAGFSYATKDKSGVYNQTQLKSWSEIYGWRNHNDPY
ncbi:MAG: RHS repeat-associated core domain-containing protein [Bacteroidota bacterium]